MSNTSDKIADYDRLIEYMKKCYVNDFGYLCRLLDEHKAKVEKAKKDAYCSLCNKQLTVRASYLQHMKSSEHKIIEERTKLFRKKEEKQ